MSQRFDAEDAAEVMRHLDKLEERYHELETLEATLREALRAVRRTRSEMRETLQRLDRLDNERAGHERAAGELVAVEAEPVSEREGPSLRKASPVEVAEEVVASRRVTRSR